MKHDFGRMMQLLARQHQDKEALVNVERGRRYSYTQFHLLTNKIANALRTRLDIGAGDRFLLILENDNLSLLHLPTIFKQSGTAAFTNLRDSLEEHQWQAETVQPKVAFIETRLLPSHAPMLQALGCAIVVMDPPSDAQRAEFPNVLSFWELVDSAPDSECDTVLDQREHISLLRFTGGTTGRGKCAMYCIDNWLAARDSVFANPGLGFDSSARMIHITPLSHGTQFFLLPTLFTGGTNITLNAVDLEHFRSTVESEQVTHAFLVPTALYRLIELHRANPKRVGTLRTFLYGAAPMSPARLSDLLECFGPIFSQAYASTEAPVLAFSLSKSDHRVDSEKAVRRLSSAGNVTAGIEVFITDESGKVVPFGQTGEIRIRSRAVIPGYYRDPEATASEFVDGAWKSGDLGYFDEDGFVYIVDRVKDMIISGGFNVYAVEVEAALATHPAVLNSAVVGVPHADWGEAVHAEVHLRQGHAVTADELISHVRGKLGGYKTPKSVAFVDELPMSVVGKVLRRRVREKYWKGQERRVG